MSTATANVECTCPNGDLWRCLDGDIYGPCTSENCGGVCELEGRCTCQASKHKPGAHGTEDDEPWP